MYAQLDRYPEALGFDPWAWASKLGAFADSSAYDAYHQIDHGKNLEKMVISRKAELMEALFPLRTSAVFQCQSWPELESSFGLHLQDIIHRLGSAKCDNAIGFQDSDITSVIIEVGRFFTELDYSNRPKDFQSGSVPDAIGPFVNGPWSEETCSTFTLDELHRRCYERGLLKGWGGNKILRIIFNGVHGVGSTERQAGLLYILEAIFAINPGRRKNWPLRKLISTAESEMFILDFLETFSVPDPTNYLEVASDQLFAAHDLSLTTLNHLGGLRIIWTDCIDDHLRLSTTSKTIALFWDISLLDQSLLFWYNARSLKRFEYCRDPSAPRNAESSLLYELRRTYRLLFYNQDAEQFTTMETCAKYTGQKTGIMVHDLRVDVSSSRRARKILKYFLRAPLPGKLSSQNDFNESIPRQISNIWWPIARALNILKAFAPRKDSTQTISTHFASGPPYSLDLCWHLENVLTPFPSMAGEKEPMRNFAQFPRFGPRLREIQNYMGNQKPGGWYQMWRDKRDRVQYVTFWAVLVFGMISIILALISIAVSSAQTVAAFRSISKGSS